MLGSAIGYLYFWGFTGGLSICSQRSGVFRGLHCGNADLAGAPWFMPALVASMSMLVGILFLLQARFAPRRRWPGT